MEFGGRTQRRMLRRAITASVIMVVGAVSLVACAPPPPKPTPTATTIFASEEEALAAATDTYAKFLASYEHASSTKGDVAASVRDYVSDEYLQELNSSDVASTNGWRTEGSSSFEVKGADFGLNTATRAQLTIQVCRDVSAVRFVDLEGTDVTPADRLNTVPLLVAFESASNGSRTLVIRGVGSWENDSCSVS